MLAENNIEFYFSENLKEIDGDIFEKEFNSGNFNLNNVEEDHGSWLYELRKDGELLVYITLSIESYGDSTKNLRISISSESENYETEIEKLKLEIKECILGTYYNTCFWLVDYQSERAHEELTRKFYRLENKFRNTINMVMIRSEGPNWFQEQGPRKYRKLYEERSEHYKQAVKNFSDIEDSLYTLLTEDLAKLLDEKREFFPNKLSIKQTEGLYNILDLASQGKKMSGIVSQLKNIQIKKKSLYEVYFSAISDRKLINAWSIITKKRNHIAHNKLIDTNLKNEFNIEIERFSEILDEVMEKFQKLNPTEEESRRRQIEQEISYSVVSDIAELESGVNIRSYEDIIEIMTESIDEAIDGLYEYFSERSDFAINSNNSYINEEKRLLLSVEYRPKNKTLNVFVNDININSEPSTESEIILKFEDESEGFEQCASLIYINGNYEYNENQGNYLPLTSDELRETNLYEKIEEIKEDIEQLYPDLLEEAVSEQSSYSHLKDGGGLIVLEDVECPECNEFETLTTHSQYFDELEKNYTEGTAICLVCGDVSDVIVCGRCGKTDVGKEEDAVCDSCNEVIMNG